MEPIDRKALLELWERAHQQAPSAFQQTDEQLYDWHLWRAEICLSEFNFEGALPHLHYLISVDPNRFRFRDMRAFAYEALEQWEEMAADLYVAASVNPNDLSCWLRIAVAELSAGKPDAFRAATAQIAASILPRHELDLVSRASFVCCMGPSVSPETLEVLKSKLSLVRHKLYDRCTYERAMAMIDFRQGNYEAVIRAADEGAIGTWRADPFFVAMAHHHLGHAEQAKAWLEKLAGMEMKRVYAVTFIYPAAVGVYRALEAEMRTVIPSTRD